MALNKIGKSYDYRAICDVCGFKKWSYELRERWDGKMVCHEDWEPRNILDFYRTRNDAHRLPWTRPDSQEISTDLTVSGYGIQYPVPVPSGIITSGIFLSPVPTYPLTIEIMVYFNRYPSELGVIPTVYQQFGIYKIFIDNSTNSPQFVYTDLVSTQAISFYTGTNNLNLNVVLPRQTWGRLSWVCQNTTTGTMYLTYKNSQGNIIQISQPCNVFNGGTTTVNPAAVNIGVNAGFSMDDFRWWSVSRTAQQIEDTWNSIVPPSLLASNYRFDEGFNGNKAPTLLYDSCFPTDSTRALIVTPATQFIPHIMQFSNSGI